ncbi:PREDICTED: zinc finger CCCH domain-containing protein 18 isoform X1 [Camelina sativa]|uniref:Zinc finger CCCH domain-containing protein 18 isoform X1 n=1 Tax=Camelina sativa TaxID=90675 RepID=A0ABM0U2D4_CAMSA|nr:PREDICTED: zinc finger CCCH domain-containing protein 18 isoform X1 [Camelina sativa]
MEEEAVESRKSRKEQERERRRLRDRERRQSMSQDEREKHLARRRKNYQLRRQRAEINRLDSQIQPISGCSQGAMNSPPDSGASLVESSDQSEALAPSKGVGIPVEELAKMMGSIRLSRLKHLARTLNKSSTNGAESSNTGASDAKTRCAMSSGLRLSRMKRLVRSKGQQEGSLSHSQTQEPELQ